MIFLCLKLRSRALEIGTHDAFINFYIGSKFQFFKFYCLLVMSKQISPHLPKNRKQKQRYYALTRSPNKPYFTRDILKNVIYNKKDKPPPF